MMTSTTQSPVSTQARDGGAKTGTITLARHGRPALSRKCWLTSDGYRDWWRRYDLGGLQAGQTAPQELVDTASKADVIFVSTLRRAQETAQAVTGGRDIITDAIFVEAPLPPPHTPSWFKMPPRLWGVTARIWWHLFNRRDGHENRSEAENRADRAAQMLIERAERGQDVLVLAHGYFNHMIGQKLKARGWRLTLDQGFKYWSQRRFEKG
ncbi:histidine phosphatase family protein [Brevundimonas sp.]|uniref:histidine phosphatase family protein n=1 Tax=Brevundimonas sp. TaxID=1871086 RepID=UPI002FCB80BE